MTRMPDPGLVITLSAGRLTRSARPIIAPSTPGSALPRLPISSRHGRRQLLEMVPVILSTATSMPNVCGNGSPTVAGLRHRR